MNPATDAQPPEDLQGDNRWMDMHLQFVEEGKVKEPDVLLIGDSIIERLSHSRLWEKHFEQLHALNFGIGGDQTQHVLWRVQNGELANLKPKVIVLHVGTNNHGHTPEQISDGIMEIITTMRELQPDSYIIFLGLLPRGKRPNKLRERNSAVNEIISSKLKRVTNVHFLPPNPSDFIDGDGIISSTDMKDYLHLTERGYKNVLKDLLDLINQVLPQGEEQDLVTGEVSDTMLDSQGTIM